MTNHPNRGRFSIRHAIAAFFSMDVADVEAGHRYQPTRTPCPIYATGNDYFTAVRIGKRPRGSDNTQQGTWTWQVIEAPRVAENGYQIWQHVEANA